LNSSLYGTGGAPLAPVGTPLIPGKRFGVAGNFMRARPFLLALGKVSVSILFLLVVLRQVSVGDLLNQLGKTRVWPLLAGLALLLSQFPLAGWRWQMVLRACGVEANAWLLKNLVWIGQFVNQVMPTFVIGDVLRGWYLTQANIPVRAAFSSLVLDRVIGLAGLLLLILVTTPLTLSEIGSGTAWTITGIAGIGIGAAGLCLFACMALLRAKLLSRWPRIEGLARDAWQTAARSSRLALIVSLAAGTNIVASMAAYFVAVALESD
jgi:uncharacterized membrane protein YbhN (UPF0104 family)